jgi:hypothetical protein
MPGTESTLRLYGQPSRTPPLDWAWVDGQLRDAGLYWVVAAGDGYPHPRPVWGVWHDERVHLTLGSPELRRGAGVGKPVTVHLDSGTDVVIVEGDVVAMSDDAVLVDAYRAKYDYIYDLATYGPFTTIAPRRVLAWRTAGPNGRDSFQQTGRWAFPGH